MVDNLDAEVEYAIALFNGTGTPKDIPTAVALSTGLRAQNSPIAQNRLARILVDGIGVPATRSTAFAGIWSPKRPETAIPTSMPNLPSNRRKSKKAEDAAKKWFGTK